MALPAGRYGVTKNQLLKIKKLPMNTIKLIEELTEKFDLLGTAAFKNSTSVVTESSDLVESGAVKDIVGWGNKNLFDKSTLQVGGLNDSGQEIENEYLRRSPFIAVNGDNVTLTIYNVVDTNRIVFCKYNANKVFIEKTIPSTSPVVGQDYSVTINITGASYIRIQSAIPNVTDCNVQIELGSTATAYEPYHASVSDSLAEKCDNSVIGTVEGANASKAWSVGEHFISSGQFKEVTQAIASGGAISDSNTVDKPIADLFTKQKITSIAVDGTILKEIVNNNSYVIPAYKLAVINLSVKIGTYTAWSNCLSGMPKPFANTGLIVANRGRSAAMFLSLLTGGTGQLTNIAGSNPEEDNVIEISATYNYNSL